MLALAIPLLTVGFGTVVLLVGRAQERRLAGELRHDVQRLARISGEVLAEPMWHVNAGRVTAGLEVIVSDDDVVVAVARDADRTVLAWAVDSSAGGTPTGGAGIRSGQGDVPPEVDLTAWLGVVEPVSFEHLGVRQKAGELEVYFTGERVAALAASRRRLDGLLLLLLLVVLVASLVVTTRRAVTTPLARWRAALRGGEEDGLQPVDWASDDELGTLVREYNDRVAVERAERSRIARRLRLFEDSVESLRRGFCVFDRDLRLVLFNRSYCELLGHGEGMIEPGMNLSTLLRTNAARGEYGTVDVDALIIDRLAVAGAAEPSRRERHRPDGTLLEVESYPLPGGGFVAIYTDVTERRAVEAELSRLALADETTALPNRALFHDRLRQALALADRTETRLAVLVIDVDRFRHVNATHGREVGDGVLREVAVRLKKLVRKSDTAARLEGDTFAVVQLYLPTIDDASLLAHRILGSLSRTFEIGRHALQLTTSIGITIYPDDDRHSRHILGNAHLALAAAQAEGRNRFRYFVPEVDRAVAERRRLEEDLFNGLRRRQFVLYYQPRLNLATGALVGAEALVRWQHPERGLMLPAEFMELAEERGLIVPLTDWILEEACRQRRHWYEKWSGGTWRLAVNLSPRHFAEGDVVASVAAALEKTALNSDLLEVEVGAAAMLHDPDSVTGGLRALRELGVATVLDGFGSGGSPFQSLRRLPLDAIKIGRDLIRDLEGDVEAAVVVKALIGLGRELRLRVGAAGIEEPQQLQLLRDEGCNEVQGEIFSPPLASDEFAAWVAGRAGPTAAAPEAAASHKHSTSPS